MKPLDSLLRASRAGTPLLIVGGAMGDRLMAEVFAVPGGIAFVDVGWTDVWLSRSPFHLVEGAVAEEIPGTLWRVGKAADVYVVDEFFPERLTDWQQWVAWCRGEGRSSLPTRARALQLIRQDIASDARDLDEEPSAYELAQAEWSAAIQAYEAAFGGLPFRLLTAVPDAELAAGLREFVAGGREPTLADFGRRFGFEPPPDGAVW